MPSCHGLGLPFPIVGSHEIAMESMSVGLPGGLGVPSSQNVKIFKWNDIDCTYLQQPQWLLLGYGNTTWTNHTQNCSTP